MEIWKDIPEFWNLFQASSKGRIRKKSYFRKNLQPARILKSHDVKGYKRVNLCHKGEHKLMLVHRLIALAFHDNPKEYPIVHHKNSLKHDNKPSNLEWTTQSLNCKYAYEQNLRLSIKTPVICIDDGRKFDSISQASKHYCIPTGSISNVINGKTKTACNLKFKKLLV